MNRIHPYKISLIWKGNKGEGTASYRSYGRDYLISAEHKPTLEGSADAVFRGDQSKYNPEDLLVAAISACHLLTYLHLCADHHIVVTEYNDHATGTMVETKEGGHFTSVILRPDVTITELSKKDLAKELHNEAHKRCFISNSCNFPVKHEPKIKVESIN